MNRTWSGGDRILSTFNQNDQGKKLKKGEKLNSNWDWHPSLLPHEEETRESRSCRDDRWDFHQTNVIINPWIKSNNRFTLQSADLPFHCCSDRRRLQTPPCRWSFSGVADMMLAGSLLLPLLTLTGKTKKKRGGVKVRVIFAEIFVKNNWIRENI